MLDAVIILAFVAACAGIGFHSWEAFPPGIQTQVTNVDGLRFVLSAFGGLIGVGVGIFAQTNYRRVEQQVRDMPAFVLLSRSIGLVIGLITANLLLAPLFLIPIPTEFSFIKPLLGVLGSILFSISGANLADVHGRSLLRLINPNSAQALLLAEGTLTPAMTKVLDTSCIIDGRITDLMETEFIEGQILVPNFVLQELQQVADSSNDQKRSRGRRGLDLLNKLRESYPERILMSRADYDDIPTVDAKLVRLAMDINGALLTNDYNLNKVASVQRVPVLNINDLAKAMRPTYLPGDSLDLKILKEGKEPAQGVGYLNDGTMVVVEDGRDHLGDNLEVVVTSALQTSAGRMIFARPKASAIA
ncbi:PIN/TRAM domain-containing protein [filamentous cyanobacterium LEGE 11480]|uniref:PIN/TRAM domain-containing protein n=1 Tax=Romeriopsis navalis LEGE 11480 TaxID=2777977 RepID=A0A928Z241_9CYAN|nr:PIN/TRAM domain-containing protein [Romeriopsis navalis]MBE9028652.1 PIN/TRAM domain-containing protein [Romeriopsis navalis LEGE 11480]